MAIDEHGEVIDFDKVSKKKLADIVNEQTQAIINLRNEKRQLLALLIAIAVDPAAFHFDESRTKVYIDQAAVDRIGRDDLIRIEATDGKYYLRRARTGEAPRIVAPPKFQM